MTNPLEQIRELADEVEACWICASIGEGEITLETINHWSGRLSAILDASQGYVCVPVDERTGICTDAHRWLLKRDLDTLISFHMQCDDMDADGYTATASEMARLAEIGMIRKVRGSVYEITSVGYFICENYWGQNPQLPLMTTADYNERSKQAMLAASKETNRG